MADRELERVLRDIIGDLNVEIDNPFQGDSDQEDSELLARVLEYPEMFDQDNLQERYQDLFEDMVYLDEPQDQENEDVDEGYDTYDDSEMD